MERKHIAGAEVEITTANCVSRDPSKIGLFAIAFHAKDDASPLPTTGI
jgi:hypothetical protein